MALTWRRALSWRLGRQLLDPVGTASVEGVVERLGAVPAWPAAAMELAIGARRAHGRDGDAAVALAEGRVVNAFAFSGAMHVMTPQDAGNYLAVRASGRMWELPSWRRYYVAELQDAPLSDAVHLLPTRDPWVMATGTSNTHVVPPARRGAVSRLANFVLYRGTLAGTWKLRRDDLQIGWFEEAGRLPGAGIDSAADALAAFIGRPLSVSVTLS